MCLLFASLKRKNEYILLSSHHHHHIIRMNDCTGKCCKSGFVGFVDSFQDRIYITGAAGYIGRNLTKYLKEQYSNQFQVRTTDLPEKYKDMDEPVDEPLDVRKTPSQAFSDDYDIVIHLAALKCVPESVKVPLDYYNTNTLGTLKLLRGMNGRGKKLLIFSSTAAVYGDHQSEYKEDDPKNPVNPYGHSKLMAEQIIRDHCATGQCRAICLRYFNVYGGEYIDKTSANLHSVIERCKESGEPITIYGRDFPTRDGTAIRDYVHMDDLARAHVLAIEYLQQHPEVNFEVFNIGTEGGKTVLEIVEESGIEYTYGPRRPGDPAKLISNCEKAKEMLGWKSEK